METNNDITETYTSVSLARAKEFKYTWKIKNFERCFFKPEHYFESPQFSIAGIKWSLDVYPNGYNSACKDYVSIRLYNYSDNIDGITSGYVELYLINQEGKPAFIQKQVLKPKLHFTKFVERKFLFDKTNGLLANEELTIECTVYYEQKFVSETDETIECPAVDATPVERRLEAIDDFERLLETDKFGDVKLLVGDKEYNVYKGILAARSRVFASIFEQAGKDTSESVVKVTDVDPVIMMEVLRYIYAGKVANVKELTSDLLAAADRYGLKSLKAICEEVLIDQLSLENLSKILVLIDRHDTDKLRDATMRFLATQETYFASMDNFHETFKPLSSSLFLEVTQVLMKKCDI